MKFICVLFICVLFSCKINQTKDGVRVGKWKYVNKDDENWNVVKGRYDKKGNEIGVWKFFYNDTIYRLEKYYYPYCVNVLYHKNGEINRVGKSISAENSWSKYGTWYTFNEEGQLTDTVTYEQTKTPQN